MTSKLSLALFVSSISLLVLNINAESEHGPQHLQEYSEVLNRLKAFTGLLLDKFVGGNVDKFSSPEAIIKPRAFPAADYQFIRIMALHANYQFDDDKLPFDQWMERIRKKDNTQVKEDQTSLQLRKQNNGRTAIDFVAIMCALIRDTIIYNNKFYEYMTVFERMEEIKKGIEQNAKELAKLHKIKWQNWVVEKRALNRQTGQSIMGMLKMKDKVLTEQAMASKPYLGSDDREEFSEVFSRQFKISGFLIDYLKQKLQNSGPKDFLRNFTSKINVQAVREIFGKLAKAMGYTDWLSELASKGSSPEMNNKGIGKVIKMLTALYVLVWEAPINNELHSMKDYYPVFEQLRDVEEHYGASDPKGWNRKVEEAKMMLKNEFARQNAAEENGEGLVTAYGKTGSNWSPVWASDNFIENSLARTKKAIPSNSHP